jgi:hypothetical protein
MLAAVNESAFGPKRTFDDFRNQGVRGVTKTSSAQDSRIFKGLFACDKLTLQPRVTAQLLPLD